MKLTFEVHSKLSLFIIFHCFFNFTFLINFASAGDVCYYKSQITENSQPQQIHLSIGRKSSEFVVTWTTFSPNDTTFVQYGKNGLDLIVQGERSEYLATDDVAKPAYKRFLYIHRVVLSDLKPLTHYKYRCGSKSSWSKIFTFKTLSDATVGSNWSPKILVYGDMGYKNARSLPYIQDEVDKGNVDLVFHNGDIGYEFQNCHSRLADVFMNLIQPVAARVPYQTSPGNHEAEWQTSSNFSNYRARFSMYDQTTPTGARSDHYYAFYLGPALVISFSTEIYYFKNFFNQKHIDWQNQWIESVLKEANRPVNRAKHPWIIVLGHRPMYCTSDHLWDDCTTNVVVLRNNLEKMFNKYRVDLAIWGHEHTYERTWPVYQSQVWYNSSHEPYKNPQATVHVISGAGGMYSGINAFDRSEPWIAFREAQYGYGILTVQDATHLKWEQKNAGGELSGYVVDTFTIVKDKIVSNVKRKRKIH